MAFHNRLKQAREYAGLTQSQVANLLGVAKSTYSGYETGKSEPSMNSIANLMRILDVSPEYLWQDEMEARFRNDYPERFCEEIQLRTQGNDEIELLESYRKLNPNAKEALLTTARAYAGNPAMVKEASGAKAI